MDNAQHLVLLGAAAGAAGATALNALTYVDMAVRGRPASSTPETTVERLPATSWVADLVPHLAYGAVTVAVLERLDPR